MSHSSSLKARRQRQKTRKLLDVEAKQAKRNKQVKPAPVADSWRANTYRQPARMIEVKPGYWISSYGCVHDEGYGRLTPCDLTYPAH